MGYTYRSLRWINPILYRCGLAGVWLILVAAFAGPGQACAASDPTVSYRVGEHGSVGRLTIRLPEGVTCSTSRSGDQELLHFSQPVRLQGPASAHVAGIDALDPADAALTVRLQPHATVRISRLGQRLVLEAADAVPSSPAPEVHPKSAASAAKTSVPAVLPGLPSPLIAVLDQPAVRNLATPAQLSPTRAAGAQPGTPSVSPSGPAAAPGDADNRPLSIAASIVSSMPSGDHGLMMPFDRNVGAAAFRRNDTLVVVFDSRKPVDLAPVDADPAFGQASFSLLPAGSVLVLPVAAGQHVQVRREPDGWLVALTGTPDAIRSLDMQGDAQALKVPVAEPGHQVVVPDPVLGTDLLVGTVRRDGQAVTGFRRRSDYTVLPALLGVVVERLSDRLEMRPTASGFVISLPGAELSRPASADAPGEFSRSLDLPAVEASELQRRYKAALIAAADSPAAARRMARLDAAEAALGLGRGREAGQLAAIADEDAPTGPDGARSAFLQAAASVLTHDPDAASRLAEPQLGNTDEVTLWRALGVAEQRPDNAEAAHAIAQRLAMLEAYPERLRSQLLGPAALSLVSGGDQAEAALVKHLDGDGQVRLAQATLLDRDGQRLQAVAALDRLAADPDPAVAGRAAEEAVDVRLKLGQIGPGQAADQLEAQILSARMADAELPLRLRIAALRAQQKDWSAALSALRDTSTSFPEASEQVHRAAATILEQIAAPHAGAPPAGAVAQLALIENNLDLLPAGADGARISLDLAGRLTELDLPDRAAVLMQRAVAQGAGGSDRARLGLALAQLSLDQNNGTAAIAALDTTEAANLSPDLAASRALLRVRALVKAGDGDGALRTLAPLHGAEAEELRAEELAARKDWNGEEAALGALVALKLPPSGPLDETGEDLVLRLVGAATRVGDQDALHQLAVAWSPRFHDGGKLDMLRLLTSSRVANVGDLQRSAAELAATRAALAAVAAAPAKRTN